MRIALIADTFPPLRNSGAVQLRDLSREFVAQGHQLTVILPSWDIEEDYSIEEMDGFQVLRLKSLKSKDVSYLRRTIAELLMSFSMRRNFKKSPFMNVQWNAVVWYAPSIFHGYFVNFLKKKNNCKSYLIIRDIFPQWAVDMELMGRGAPYHFFNVIAKYQYSVADTIGVQTPGNLTYFKEWIENKGKEVVVLQNWLADTKPAKCSIDIENTILAGRKIFVYAGNMGIAQGMDVLIDLAEKLKSQKNIGFLFVGRGSEVNRLAAQVERRLLDNVLFKDEIHPDDIPALYAQCAVGIVSLDQRHKSHNIPGKFISYMQSGLPVLANINPGNDLKEIIDSYGVGVVCENANVDELERKLIDLMNDIEVGKDIYSKCRLIYRELFSPENAVKQIVSRLKK